MNVSGSSQTHPRALLEILLAGLEDYAIVLTDQNGFFTTWHPGVEKIFGYSATEFVGQHTALLFPPADRLTGAPEQELASARAAGRASDTCRLMRKDGELIWAQGITLSLRDQSGTLIGFGKLLADVSGQRQSDQSLHTFVRALEQSAVIVRTWEGTIQHWTAGCQQLYGWSAQEAVGQICQVLLKTRLPLSQEQVDQQLLQATSWKGELIHVHRDGTPLTISAYWVLMRDAGGEPHLVIETQTDITALSKMRRDLESAHEELQKVRDELERSNEELEEFARIASHDLSAPITSTRWLVDLLSSRYSSSLDQTGREAIEKISLGLARMSELVEGILSHAIVGRASTGSEQICEARHAIAAAAENLRHDISASHAVIHHDALPTLPLDCQSLTRLFQNLISNAIKYRQANRQPEVSITAEGQGSMWLFSVCDNGIGIEPEWFDRIFQPMQRLGGLNVSGSGIGLATCRKIVRRAGGQIWVQSRLGVGSTFLFTLPGLENTANGSLPPASP